MREMTMERDARRSRASAHRLERNTVVGVDLLVAGGVLSGLGFSLAQSVPIAALGFALMVIGALVFLVVPEQVPQDALRALLKDSMRNVEMILEESALKNRAYFVRRGDGDILAFVPTSTSAGPFTASDIGGLGSGPRRFLVDREGMRGVLLVPPGNEIVRLSGVEVGTDLEEALRSVLVEQSDLAAAVLAVEEEGGRVAKIQISRPRLASGSPYFRGSLGSPVSCVACCVTAAVKGAPVRAVEEMYDPGLVRLTLRTLEAQ